jgi:hypothetical protein
MFGLAALTTSSCTGQEPAPPSAETATLVRGLIGEINPAELVRAKDVECVLSKLTDADSAGFTDYSSKAAELGIGNIFGAVVFCRPNGKRINMAFAAADKSCMPAMARALPRKKKGDQVAKRSKKSAIEFLQSCLPEGPTRERLLANIERNPA